MQYSAIALATELGNEEGEREGGCVESVAKELRSDGSRQREQVSVVVFQLCIA